MPKTLFPNGINVPDNIIVQVAKAYGVTQGEGEGIDPEETVGEAWVRVNQEVFKHIKRPFDLQVKQDAAEAAEPAGEMTENQS